jgi:YVTN family beta-propeller protein
VADSHANEVVEVDETELSVTRRLAVGKHPMRIVANDANHDLYVTNLEDSSVSIIDTDAGHVRTTLPVGQEPFRIAPWESRGRNELVVLCRAGVNSPNGALVFVDGLSRVVVDRVELPGRAANWIWAAGSVRKYAYVTLADAPLLVYFDAINARVIGVLSLEHQPEPTGNAGGLVIGRGGAVFVATRDEAGVGSVTVLTSSER